MQIHLLDGATNDLLATGQALRQPGLNWLLKASDLPCPEPFLEWITAQARPNGPRPMCGPWVRFSVHLDGAEVGGQGNRHGDRVTHRVPMPV